MIFKTDGGSLFNHQGRQSQRDMEECGGGQGRAGIAGQFSFFLTMQCFPILNDAMFLTMFC